MVERLLAMEKVAGSSPVSRSSTKNLMETNPLETGAAYIRQCRSLGFSDPEIVQALQKTGWQTMDIQAALLQAAVAEPTKKSSNHWLWIILVSLCAALIVAAGIVTWLFTSSRIN